MALWIDIVSGVACYATYSPPIIGGPAGPSVAAIDGPADADGRPEYNHVKILACALHSAVDGLIAIYC